MAVTIIVVAAIASPLVARLGLRMVLIAGLGMFAVGIVWFGQLPVHAGYLADLLGPSLLIALWLGLAFVPITILAETGVQDREYGLASGLVNASQQIGGARGLAVLTTIATSPTNHLIASSHTFGQALTLGFHLGLLGAAAFVLLAIIAAAAIGPRRTNRSQLPPPARQPEPQTCFDCLDQPRSASSLRGWSRSATFASDTNRAAHPHAASNSLTTGCPNGAVADPAGIDQYS